MERPVDRDAREMADAARGLHQRLHRHQHALDVGVLDDRAHAGAGARRAALPALAGIAERVLIGALCDRDALHADREARAVHHHEHRREASVFLADQPALGAAGIAVDHHAGRRGVDAELVLEARAAHVVALAERAVRLDQELGNEEQREAARAGGRVGQAREHEVDDVVGEVVLAVGDEDLLAEDAVGSVLGALGAALDRIEVGARLRLGQVHRAGPFAADHAAHVGLAQFGARMDGERADRALGQQRAEREAHRGAVPDFAAGEIDRMRQAHAAVLGRGRHARPARLRPAPVGLAKTLGRGHAPVLAARAFEIAGAVERRDHVGREAPGLADDGRDGLRVELAEQARFDFILETGDMVERKQNVGDRRSIGHRNSLPAAPRRRSRDLDHARATILASPAKSSIAMRGSRSVYK